MSKPNVLVFSGYGINCENEVAFAFETVGAEAQIVHINELIQNPKKLDEFQIAAFPGGFAYGDDTGAGNAYAHKIRNHLWDEILGFVQRDTLTIGICNGFQILVNLGLLPAFRNEYGLREVALTHNDSARYVARWVDLQVTNNTPWFSDIKTLPCPTAHGEGKFVAPRETLKKLHKNNQIAAIYTKGEMCEYQNLDPNPNGSLDDIAAITDKTTRILGVMPHPDRALFFTQLPHWPLLKEKYKRNGKILPKYGPGLKVFENGVNYFQNK